jgi:pyrimidine-specific ribonucleoside hydrolase
MTLVNVDQFLFQQLIGSVAICESRLARRRVGIQNMSMEYRDPFEVANETIDALRSHAQAVGSGEIAEEMSRRYPPRLHDAPMVIDIDLGGDPDGALALAVAAREVPELKLVVTSDEHAGRRARFARHLLDLLGRADVAVVAGRELDREDRQFCADGLIPDTVPSQPGDPATAIAAVLGATEGMVRWAGCGPMSNLAGFVGAHPELIDRLNLDQLAGAVDRPGSGRAEWTIDRDRSSARGVLGAVNLPWLVTSDLGESGELAFTVDSSVYRWLAEPDAPGWARLLRIHFDHWFERHQPASTLRRTLTIAMATGMPFFRMVMDRVAIDERGRMRLDPAGVSLFYPLSVDYQAFWWWLPRMVGAIAPTADRDAPGGSG